jgi:hypothetical protein
MELIPDADHTFSTVTSQRALIDVLREHLLRLHERGDASRTSNAIPASHTETARIA